MVADGPVWWAPLAIGCLVGLLSGCALFSTDGSSTARRGVDSAQRLTDSKVITIERVPGTEREPEPVSPEDGAAPAATPGPRQLPGRETDLRSRFPGKTVRLPSDLPPPSLAQQDYLIGGEDVLKIAVWQHPDLSVDVTVRPDGKISFSPLGEVEVAGLRPGELQRRLTTLLEKFLYTPQVTVVPVQMPSRKVFFVGHVKSSGTVLRQRNQSLLETIAEVEILDNADLSETYVLRDDLVVLVDLARLLDGDLSQNLTLQPQDKVVIPALTKEVFVLGAVAKPGKYILPRRAHLIDALSLAGGPTENTHLPGAYMVRGTAYMPLNMHGVLRGGELQGNIALERGDLLFFPSADENKVFVLGEVNKPGPVRSPTPLNIVEALAAAGGLNNFAAPTSVRVVRGNPHDPLVLRVDMAAIVQGNQADRLKLQHGDIVHVPPSWLASWNRFVNLILPGITTSLAVEALRATTP